MEAKFSVRLKSRIGTQNTRIDPFLRRAFKMENWFSDSFLEIHWLKTCKKKSK
ncbi:hypothetical protein LSS_02022 [Leptospira santarosai serovar Shermani str. LT 821]|uniref:Uncharacterized protein n=1 Tax=Leptospira santarosai serovar Shermani str. LT 821 TaxID=758847 RepID=K8YH18_9LEPT|nr:hypothetical protein LSS_02022 [Leptospira santarosai serovar Shermani str. LT 821]